MDPSSELPSGESFANFTEFRTVLTETRSEPFVRNLIKQVLTYSTGRHMETVDEYEIDEIFSRVQADNNGLRTLVMECLTSEIFRSR